jgi:predicted component of type VI protein secretion system
MKVSLVVASGAHEGKVIQISGSQFLIGRDTQCQLRPASQAISKHHCGILVRDGQIYIKDYGSTNGTLVNDELLRGSEVMVVDGASLKLGPLDFTVRIETSTPKPDGTPLPSASLETAATLAAVKAATGSVAIPKQATSRDATPNPAQTPKPSKPTVAGGSKETAPLTDSKIAAALKAAGSKEGTLQSGSKEAAALKATAAKSTPPKSAETKPTPKSAEKTSPPKSDETKVAPETTLAPITGLINSEDDDKMAAMLLGMEDEAVPEGSTVVDMPAVDSQGNPIVPSTAKADDKAGKKAVAQTREEMSSAASDLLRKMMRRPK